MSIELWWLFVVALAYLGILFLIAYATDSGRMPAAIVQHPATYALSLGVYATSWTYYGSVGLADSSGYAFLTIYLGVTGAFLLGPYLLRPILRLCRDHQLASIADLLAFRYGGRGTGFIVTLFMLVGILPYISLQIRAVTESIQVLSRQAPPDLLALSFCLLITVFAILFGARHLSPREKHHGLVVAIAFESAVKLIALLIAGLFVVTQVFDSPTAFGDWMAANPDDVQELYAPGHSSLWSTLLLLAFCAAFLLPRQYHMTFVENENPRHLNTAYWLFPLYLLLLNLPIIPILFAGKHLQLTMEPDFYVLGITLTLGREWLAIVVFLGGLSAASAMMIVTTLALSYMCLNHLLLPASLSSGQPTDFYRRLIISKRIIIALIIAAGYGFYIIIELNEGLASLGLISFVAAAQLLPGVIGLLFWPRATQSGFLAGLIGGALVWFALLIWPLFNTDADLLARIPINTDIWTLSTFCSLTVNGLLFVIGSLLTKSSADEQAASQSVLEQASFALGAPFTARSALHYRYALQQVLGSEVADHEMTRACRETGIELTEKRPTELRLLHEQLERNMTGLLGPTLARSILRLNRPQAQPQTQAQPETPEARLLEMRLEASRQQMRGMTKQLDDLRRYLRDVLREMPVGVCSIAADGNIYVWNVAMQNLTGIAENEARETSLSQLPEPWNPLLPEFANSTDTHRLRCRVLHNGKAFTVNLHKADIGTPTESDNALPGQVILMEDRTNIDTLEAELAHSERLASIGRLAAGVAHEIGNPLTGIASISQNLLHESSQDTELEEQAGDILEQVNRINTIVRSLLTFSHAEGISGDVSEPVIIEDSVNEALRLVRLSPDIRDLSFRTELPDAVVQGDPNQLVQVFVNLINNACDASPPAGEVAITGTVQADRLQIRIADLGDGIDDDDRDRVFEPFYTTKPVGQGTGLGLSLVYSIVSNHGGRIRVEHNHPRGSCMVVNLPLSSASPTSTLS